MTQVARKCRRGNLPCEMEEEAVVRHKHAAYSACVKNENDDSEAHQGHYRGVTTGK